MMKQHSKYSAFVAGLIGVTLLAPVSAFAQTSAGAVAERKPASGNFCARVDELTMKVATGVNERQGKYHTKRTENRSKLSDRFGARDLKRVEHRSLWGGKREEWRTKLAEKATTPEQKSAVEKFITGMDVAIATRRSAVDQAVKEFRAGLESATVARQSAVDSALATMKNEIDMAIAKAKSDCGSGVEPRVARESFTTSLKSAREKFRGSVKALEDRKDTLEPLANARKLAVENAIKQFKETTAKLKVELKEVLVTN